METDLHSTPVGLPPPVGGPMAVPSLYDPPPVPPRPGPARPAPRSPAARRAAPKTDSRNGRWVLEWVAVVVVALLLAVGVRTWVAQMFYIPSGSMLPTLQIGDRIIVDKLSYRLHDVHRGDIVVFRRPPLEQADYSDLVKRVIGLPGDTVSSVRGRIYIDGRPLNEPWLPTPEPTTSPSPLPDAFSLNHPYTVPAGEYFVMGDNRTDSEDSRYFGPIAKSLIVGKLVVVVWPLDDNGWLVVLAVLAAALVVAIVMVALRDPVATRPTRGAHLRGPPVPGTP